MEFWAYGEAKASRVRELAGQRGYQLADCYAYSDSVTDLPLLETVGHPHAVNPDRSLRRIARDRGWPVLTFGTRLTARPGRAAPAPGPGLGTGSGARRPVPAAVPAAAPVTAPASRMPPVQGI